MKKLWAFVRLCYFVKKYIKKKRIKIKLKGLKMGGLRYPPVDRHVDRLLTAMSDRLLTACQTARSSWSVVKRGGSCGACWGQPLADKTFQAASR